MIVADKFRWLPAFVFAIIILATHAYVAAYEFKTLASFPGGQLMSPTGALATDGTYLYGTTMGPYPNGGAAFRVALDGSGLTAIRYLNNYYDGLNPFGGVTVANSQLFGVTYRGGILSNGTIGSGTVFSMNLDGSNHQLLRTFGDAASPTSGPNETVVALGSTLYGTTVGSLSTDFGTIYSVNSDGTNFQLLHNFNGTDGSSPLTRLQLFNDKLYGATAGFSFQNLNGGTIFSINTDGTNFQVLHTLANGDGAHVEGDLAIVGGKLYGVTTQGGTYDGGTIFRLNLDGTGFETLHEFVHAAPQSGLTYLAGKLYGTTAVGNTIFSIDPDSGDFRTVHTFIDEMYPTTRLLAIGSTLYGTTQTGGNTDNGTIYAFTIPEPSTSLLLVVAILAVVVSRGRARSTMMIAA